MADKFERGEPVLVWDGNRDYAEVRLFSHMSGTAFGCACARHETQLFSGEEYPTLLWYHAEKLPKPPMFRKGELVVEGDECLKGQTWFFERVGKVRARPEGDVIGPKGSIRRPTIEELTAWLPWCTIEAK